MSNSDIERMREKLAQARIVALQDEVSVVTVLVDASGGLLAIGYNQPIGARYPTTHAEIVTATSRLAGNRTC